MSGGIQKRIHPVFKEAPTSDEESGDAADVADENKKSSLLSRFWKIVDAAKNWDPFPLRAHDLEDVNEANKRVLLAIITLLLCTSFALIWFSVFIIDSRRSHEYASTDSFSSHILSFSAIVLVISLVSFTFSLCGFVGVFRENIILIRIFYIALIVLLSVKLIIALFTFTFTGTAGHIVGSIFGNKLILNYRESTDIETAMDYLQVKFHCCGLREQGFKDWDESIYFKCSDRNPSTERCGVPWSCCRNETGIRNALCGKNVQKLDRNIASRAIYTKGCIIAILEWAKNHAFLVAFLLLLETLLLTALIFQSTHLVNELQMISGVYRGPWWIWISKPGPDARQPFLRGATHRDGQPDAALPFHLELVWHEAPDLVPMAIIDQHSSADSRQKPYLTGQPSQALSQKEVTSTEPPGGSGSGISQQGSVLVTPLTGAPRKQRRSTAGQRFFRAVLSRASRLVDRRRAMSAAEERRRSSAGASAGDPPRQSGQTSSDWVIHHRARDDGALGAAEGVTHAMDAIGEEAEMDPAEASMPLQAPLPSIGERARVNPMPPGPQVLRTTEVPAAPEVTQDDQTRRKERRLSMKKPKPAASPSLSATAVVVHQKYGPSELEETQPQLPGFVSSHDKMSLPNIHSQQGSSKHMLQMVPKFSGEGLSDKGSSPQGPCDGGTKHRQSTSSTLTVNAFSSALAVQKSDFKSPTSSRIALVLGAVEPIEEPDDATSPPTTTLPDEAVPAPLGEVERDSMRPAAPILVPTAITVHHPAPAVSSEPTSAEVLVSEWRPSVSVTAVIGPTAADDSAELAADVSPRRTVSVVEPDSGDADAGYRDSEDDEAVFQESSALNGESPAGQEGGVLTAPAHGHKPRKELSDASTSTHFGKKGKKEHYRRAKLHKKREKKGHIAPAEEEAGSGVTGDENEPIHEWLKPTHPKTPDRGTNEGRGSAYFSPSEFQHLAVRQSPKPTNDASDHKSQRRSLATVISGKLHEMFSYVDLQSGESSEPKPSTSGTHKRLVLPPEPKSAPQERPDGPGTSRGPASSGEVIPPASSSMQSPETESDSEHEA